VFISHGIQHDIEEYEAETKERALRKQKERRIEGESN
jgi:hypothetical protein